MTKPKCSRWALTVLIGLVLGVTLSAQGPLSNQVLQLLTRVNSWTATNTFLDLRLSRGVPSATTDRFVEDNAGNLYFNGQLVAGAGGGGAPHNLLSTTHADTLPASVARGSVIVGNATPAWSRLLVCAAGSYLGSDGTDTGCRTSAASFTAIPAGQITGTASAFVGTAITALNASNLASGTVPLAQLSGILNAQIGGGAAIVYSKLSLTGGIVNTDVNAAAAIAYSKLALTGSIVTGDLTAATLLFDRWASNSCTNLQVPQYNGAAWVCKSLVPSDITGAGTVTSAALTAPAIFSVAGSPITTAGTLAVTLATQTANLVWAGPTTGAASAPTFRGLVNADLPLTGVGAGSYAKVTVNTAGVVTAGAAANLTTDVTGTLPRANGGTGVAVSGDDTVLVGNGAAWVAQTIPDCPTGALAYTQATNLFNCSSTGGPTHNLLSATHTDTLAAAVVRGDMVVGNATPLWARVALGTAGQLWTNNAVDPSWSNTIARGTIVTSTPWTFTQTWNAGGVTFAGLVVNISNSASAAGSLLADFQLAGTSQFKVDRSGVATALVSLNSALYQSTAAKILLTGTGTGPSQLAVFQTTVPTCSTNCGTSPSVVGSDTFMKVTMGSSGSPASGWVVTFNGTWAAAPSCTVQMALSGMVVGKQALTAVATATTLTVVTNGTAPSTSDVYAIHCAGVQ